MCAAKVSFLSPKRRVLMTGDEGIVLFSSSGSGIERECSIPWAVPNFEEQLLDALTAKNKKFPVLVLYDAVEQHYRRETLPRVSSLDRAKVLKRKLDLTFPSYPIRAALLTKSPAKKLPPGAEKPQPTYIFTALPGTETLDKISEALVDAQVGINGLSLLPIESTGLVEKLTDVFVREGKKKSRWAVMIGQHETGGLRQIVVRDGQLALTRLTPAAEGALDGIQWAGEVEREFKATLSYIARFGYNASEGLDVIVICNQVAQEALQKFNLPATNLKCLTVAEAAHSAGLKIVSREKIAPGTIVQEYADILHAAWAGLKMQRTLSLTVPALQQIQKPRAAAQFGSGLLIIAALVLSANLADRTRIYLDLGKESETMEAQRDLLNKEYAQETAEFDALPVNPDVVAAVLDIHKSAEERALRPNPFLNRLRNVLLPDARIDSIEIEDKSDDPGRPASAVRQDGGQKPESSVSVVVKFDLPSIKNLEQKVLRAEALTAALKGAFPEHSVTIERQFEGVTREGSFSGDLGLGNRGGRGSSGSSDMAEILIQGPRL